MIRDRRVGRLLSVNVGLPRDLAWRGQTVHTAVWKRPVDGPRMARWLNIDGGGQGDLAGHGGEHRAVFVYQIESYRYWQEQLGRDDFEYGQFGENFTIQGLADDQVCIGDRYRIGEAVFEVTSPGSPATGSVSGWTTRGCLRCWSPITGPDSTSGCCERALCRRGMRSCRRPPGPRP